MTFTINHIETKKIDALPDLTIALFHKSRAGNGCSSKDHAPAMGIIDANLRAGNYGIFS